METFFYRISIFLRNLHDISRIIKKLGQNCLSLSCAMLKSMLGLLETSKTCHNEIIFVECTDDVWKSNLS